MNGYKKPNPPRRSVRGNARRGQQATSDRMINTRGDLWPRYNSRARPSSKPPPAGEVSRACPGQEKSLTDKVSLHDNLIIHGDNLKAFKALLPLYAGKIKCVYIDPPYNTGNEKWIYNDNVNSR